MKTCPKCKQTLPNSEFNRNKARPDGLNTHCKKCASAYVVAAHKKKPAPKEKMAAWNAVAYAIRTGKLQPANTFVCAYCKTNPAIEYHHYKGYAPVHRLKVKPVCRGCHTKLS